MQVLPLSHLTYTIGEAWDYYHPHFTDEETEVLKGEIICPKLRSQ